MTANGPEALRLVGNAYTGAGILVARPILISITGVALDVTAGTMNRDAGIDTVAYRWDLHRHTAARLLDLAVEALTADPQE